MIQTEISSTVDVLIEMMILIGVLYSSTNIFNFILWSKNGRIDIIIAQVTFIISNKH